MKIVYRTKTAASAVAQSVFADVPRGAVIYVIVAHNHTTFWKTCAVGLVNSPDETASFIYLIPWTSQPGDRQVVWNGPPIKAEGPFVYVKARFNDCATSDVLSLLVGYEMPPAQPRRWW